MAIDVAVRRNVFEERRVGWTTSSIPNLASKTFIVTGGNSGIGLATTVVLARKGGKVILACRDPKKGVDALANCSGTFQRDNVIVARLDLADLASVKTFAEQMLSELPRLDVLINNAGVMTPPLGRTKDGFETQFGTNVLGHFALTGLLLPLLNKTKDSRVVTLSSVAHWYGRIDFGNLNAEQGYSKHAAYGQSKLANLMLAYELQRRLARSGANTISVGAHPGATKSALARHDKGVNALMSAVAQSVENGALPSLMAATELTVKGGNYIGPGGFLTIRGLPTVQKSSARSHDPVVAMQLWEKAQELTGVRYL